LSATTAKLLIEGWRGFVIEANPQSVAQMNQHFKGFIDDRKLTLLESRVTAENINDLWPEER